MIICHLAGVLVSSNVNSANIMKKGKGSIIKLLDASLPSKEVMMSGSNIAESRLQHEKEETKV